VQGDGALCRHPIYSFWGVDQKLPGEVWGYRGLWELVVGVEMDLGNMDYCGGPSASEGLRHHRGGGFPGFPSRP